MSSLRRVSEPLETLRARIAELVTEYHDAAFAPEPFVPGETPVRCAGRVFDADDMRHLVEATLDFWLTSGRFAEQFEREFARWWGRRHCVLVNSGSSANLRRDQRADQRPSSATRALRPGDEVITVAAGFPTTVNPMVQNGLVPVFARRRRAHLQHRRPPPRGGAVAAHARRHDRAHAGQPVRPRRGHAPSAPSTTCG